ncbi:Chaperone surA [Gossypium australe]|uniref:Chaperone surA n=1 Tax=Gossypium australe TaxID=47621 RepID=A0A5B6WHL4_9ROSI|nr:Chaperone surA [Gossypium australe]
MIVLKSSQRLEIGRSISQYSPVRFGINIMSSNQARTESEEAESTAQASVQRAVSSSSRRPESEGQGEEAKEAFFQMMNEWFTEFIRTNPAVQQPPPPAPQPVPYMPQGVELVRTGKPPVYKIRKYGAEDFRATAEDDLKRAEFWLKNTIRVLDELTCTPAECLKCVVSLLKDSASSGGYFDFCCTERKCYIGILPDRI